MPRKSRLYQKEARATATLVFECHAPQGLFVPKYDDIPKRIRDDVEKHGSIPCEGGGTPGEWCQACRFGAMEEE